MRLRTSRRIPRDARIRMESLDMVGNMKDIMNMYQRFRQNPMQMLNQRFNIPQSVNMSDPNSIIQHLLNTGQVSQDQVNNAMRMRNQFR